MNHFLTFFYVEMAGHNRKDTEKISMAPALRMTRNLGEVKIFWSLWQAWLLIPLIPTGDPALSIFSRLFRSLIYPMFLEHYSIFSTVSYKFFFFLASLRFFPPSFIFPLHPVFANDIQTPAWHPRTMYMNYF
jgi:hypothetical protein